MNWEAFGAISELVGALGVIATLVFFMRQLRQMSDQTASTNSWSVSQALSDTNNMIASDAELAEIWLKAHKGLNELTEVEAARYRFCVWSRINTLIYIFEHEPPSAFRLAIDQVAATVARNAGFRQVCEEAKSAMPDGLFERLMGGA